MADKLKFTNKLRGSRILIIGGSSGIGFGVAEAALEHGAADIMLSSSSQAKLDTAVARLKANYPTLAAAASIRAHACDLRDTAKVDASLRKLLDAATHGRTQPLSHLVCTPGDSIAFKPLAQVTAADVVAAGAVRFVGQFLAVSAAAAHGYMAPGADASITLTAGSVGERPERGWSLAAGYAAGIAGLARNLALDCAPVRVNVVSPGAVDTEMWAAMGAERRDALLGGLAGVLPTGRVGRTEDVAEAYLYAMKDGFVTGSVIATNGGYLLLGPGDVDATH